jgi:hypothetical protein
MANMNHRHRTSVGAALTNPATMVNAIYRATSDAALVATLDVALVITLDMVQTTPSVMANMATHRHRTLGTALVITLDMVRVTLPVMANMAAHRHHTLGTALVITLDMVPVATLDAAHTLRNRRKQSIIRYPKNKFQRKLANSGTFLTKPFF